MGSSNCSYSLRRNTKWKKKQEETPRKKEKEKKVNGFTSSSVVFVGA
jgi:hypothetical protein